MSSNQNNKKQLSTKDHRRNGKQNLFPKKQNKTYVQEILDSSGTKAECEHAKIAHTVEFAKKKKEAWAKGDLLLDNSHFDELGLYSNIDEDIDDTPPEAKKAIIIELTKVIEGELTQLIKTCGLNRVRQSVKKEKQELSRVRKQKRQVSTQLVNKQRDFKKMKWEAQSASEVPGALPQPDPASTSYIRPVSTSSGRSWLSSLLPDVSPTVAPAINQLSETLQTHIETMDDKVKSTVSELFARISETQTSMRENITDTTKDIIKQLLQKLPLVVAVLVVLIMYLCGFQLPSLKKMVPIFAGVIAMWFSPDISKWISSMNTEAEANFVIQADDEETDYGLLKELYLKVFKGLIGTIVKSSVGKLPTLKNMHSIMRVVADIPRTFRSAGEIWSWFLEVIQKIFDWVSTSVLNRPTPLSIRCHGEKVDDWLKRAHSILTDEVSQLLPINNVNYERVKKTLTEGEELSRLLTLGKTPIDRLGVNVVSNHVTALRKIFGNFGFMGQVAPGIRLRPVGVLFRGGSGIGKSYCIVPLFSVVLQKLSALKLGKEVDVTKLNNSMFFKTEGDEYYDGYLPDMHEVYVHDEAFAIRESDDKNATPIGIQLMKEINDVPYQVKMAGVEQKGTMFFRAKFVVASTNKMDLSLQNQVLPEAVWNRLPFDLLVVPNEKYCIDPSVPDKQKRINTSHPDLILKPGWFRKDVVKYVLTDKVTKIEKDISFDELVDMLVKAYQLSATKYDNFIDSMTKMLSEQQDIFNEQVAIGVFNQPMPPLQSQSEQDITMEDLNSNDALDEIMAEVMAEVPNEQPSHDYNWYRKPRYYRNCTFQLSEQSSNLLLNLHNSWNENLSLFDDTVSTWRQDYLYDIAFVSRTTQVIAQLVAHDPLTIQHYNSMNLLGLCKFLRRIDKILKTYGLSDTPISTDHMTGWSYYIQAATNMTFYLNHIRQYMLGAWEISYTETKEEYGFEAFFIVLETICYGGLLDMPKVPIARMNVLPNPLSWYVYQVSKYETIVGATVRKLLEFPTKFPMLTYLQKKWQDLAERFSMLPLIVDAFIFMGVLVIGQKVVKKGFSLLSGVATTQVAIEKAMFVSQSGEKARTITFKPKAVVKMKAQGARDQNAEEMLGLIMAKNWYHVISPISGKQLHTVLFIKKKTFLCMHHFKSMMQAWVDDPDLKDAELIFRNETTNQQFLVHVSKYAECIKQFKETDIGYGELSIPIDMRDISQLFISEKVHTSHPDLNIMFPRIVEQDKVQIYVTKAKIDASLEYNSEDKTIKYEIINGMTYNIPTVAGECATPIVISNQAVTGGKILGLHAAGSSTGLGAAVPVTQEVVDQILNSCSDDDQFEVFVMPDLTDDVEPTTFIRQGGTFPLEGNFEVLGMVNDAPYTPSITKIRTSRMYQIVSASTKTPARRFLHVGNSRQDLRIKALNEYGKPDPTVNKTRAEATVASVFQELIQKSDPKEMRHTKVYSAYEACQGVPSIEHFKSITRKTSPGYPYINRKTIGMKGKVFWFGEEEEYDMNTSQFKELMNDVVTLINQYIVGLPKDNKRVIFMDVDKDELLPKLKVALGKLRMFSAGPLDYLIVCRMYFMGFAIWTIENRIKNHCAVGINVYSDEWDGIARLLGTYQDCVAGDYQKFDKSQIYAILMLFVTYINMWYNDGPECAKIRIGIFQHLANSVHLFEGHIYKWLHALPSGHFLTIIVNNLMNLFFLNYTWRSVVPSHMVDDMWKNTYILVGGDDHIFSVSKNAKKYFNFKVLEEFLPVLNQKYTTEKKDGTTYVTKPLSECSFYKRSFRKSTTAGRYVGPLDMETILEMFQWTKSAHNREQIERDNIKQALLELSLHPEKLWNKWAYKIMDAAAHYCEYDVTYYTRVQMMRECLALSSFF